MYVVSADRTCTYLCFLFRYHDMQYSSKRMNGGAGQSATAAAAVAGGPTLPPTYSRVHNSPPFGLFMK